MRDGKSRRRRKKNCWENEHEHEHGKRERTERCERYSVVNIIRLKCGKRLLYALTIILIAFTAADVTTVSEEEWSTNIAWIETLDERKRNNCRSFCLHVFSAFSAIAARYLVIQKSVNMNVIPRAPQDGHAQIHGVKCTEQNVHTIYARCCMLNKGQVSRLWLDKIKLFLFRSCLFLRYTTWDCN